MILSSRLKASAAIVARGVAGLALSFALIAGATPTSARQAATAPVQAPAAVPAIQGQGPALWVVKDADSTLYLFGSVHVLRPTTGWESPRVKAAFDSASDVWFEISNPDDQAAIVPLIQQYGVSPTYRNATTLTTGELTLFANAAHDLGLDAVKMDNFRPWFAGLMLSVTPLVKAGYDPKSGVEIVLKARAEAAGKPVHGFETVDKQVRILADMPEAVQLAFLRETLKDYDEATVKLDEMVADWARGDVPAIERLMVQEMKTDSPALYQALLVDRNTDWANQIQTLLQGSGTAFIAVGAAHLAGPDSVQAQLKARGVDVEAVQ